jgi:uncharacterized damage-inducible protein DinB
LSCRRVASNRPALRVLENDRTTVAEAAARTGSELQLLHVMIKSNRDSLLWKLEEISDERARERVVPSLTTLIGLVKHMQLVERWWVRMVMDGEDLPLPWSVDDHEEEWRLTDSDTVDSAVTAYAEELAIVDAVIERQDDLGREVEARNRTYAVRWILMHLVEEIARHAGHADIIRETLDGETGYVRG